MDSQLADISALTHMSIIPLISHKREETLYDMTYNIAVVAIPSIIVMALYLAIQPINLTVVGHLGDPAMIAGVGLGNLYLNMFS